MKFSEQARMHISRILALACMLGLAACGGSRSSSSSSPSLTIATPAANVTPITIDSGPANSINLAFITITLCAPGDAANCQTIDHIQLDTGSVGLRVISSVLNSTLLSSLPQRTDGNGNALAECQSFADGFTFGSVKSADLKIASEVASALSIQVIGDPSFAAIPADCANTGAAENTVMSFGANGLLGIGTFAQDCGTACANAPVPGTYYACTGATCQLAAISIDKQIQNPILSFRTDNNGTIIELPAISSAGAAAVTGALVFGIGTEANNQLGNATIETLDPATGNLAVQFNNNTLPNSYLDSGSNALFVDDPSLPVCSGGPAGSISFCPAGTVNLTASLMGRNGVNRTVAFSVANANQLFFNNSSFTAFDNLADPNGDPTSFDFGLPFFFGRAVFTAIENQNTMGGMGPYIAF